ncbi:MAG: (Fe-S)-binding protein [Acidimicrobiaceae bacterium]|nr:(Fe-S)-binding protein [Acidimicrobiaceae bacterium]
MARTLSLFVSCFNDTLYPKTAKSAEVVLNSLGIKVEFPRKQTCCGQIHINTGFASGAIPLMRNFIDTFEASEEIVALSGSCTAMIREHYQDLAERTHDSGLIARTEELVPRVFEFSEYLTNVLGITDVGASYPHRVVYHPTCHSLRSLHIYDSAVRLLCAVKGLELVVLPYAEQCCGFGGTFSIKNSAMSAAILADKVGNIVSARAETVVALDNSCLMHISGALRRNNTGISVMHLAEVLAHGLEAIEGTDGQN